MLTRTRPATGDVAAVLGRLAGAGLAEPCEVTLPVDRLKSAGSLAGVAGGRVRLTSGRGARVDPALVRCLTALMAGGGQPALPTADPRRAALTGERAAWNDRTPDSWEHVMPYGVHVQRRLLAAGPRVVRGAHR